MPASHIAIITVAAALFLSAIILMALEACTSKDNTMDPTMWAAGWPHEAPDHPLSAVEAHQIWRSHAACPIDCCQRKAAAIEFLIGDGRIVPDDRMVRVYQ
jgi:hypothetical protein